MFTFQEVKFSSLNFVHGYNERDKIYRVQKELYQAELNSVINGYRTAYVGSVPINQFNELKRNYSNLYFYIIAYVKPYSGFAHRHDILNKPTFDANVHFVMSNKQLDEQYLRKLYQTGGNEYHKYFGEILGYPECCINWFCEYWNTNRECCYTHYDLVWHMNDLETINTSKLRFDNLIVKKADGYPECNPFLRYCGIRLITYMPCSMKCEGSRKFGQMIASLIDDKEIVQYIYDELKRPAKWSRYHGIVIVNTSKYFIFNDSDFTVDKQEVYINGYHEPEVKFNKIIKDYVDKYIIR